MKNEIFVDGICEIDDKTVKAYFGKFGSRITAYAAFRHCSTNACCFALISFDSPHTVNAVQRHRPHTIDVYPLFVKRMLPENTCSFNERLLPVTSLFAYRRTKKELDQNALKNYFNEFGHLLTFAYEERQDRFMIEYADYDAVDRLLLGKAQLPFALALQKNMSPAVHSNIQYYGTCRKKTSPVALDQQQNQPGDQKIEDVKPPDFRWQDLLQLAVADLAQCKAELKTKRDDYRLLQLENTSLKEKAAKLTAQLDERSESLSSCPSCAEFEGTISLLQQTLTKLNEQCDTIKSEYQRLLAAQATPRAPIKFATRLMQRPAQLPLKNCTSGEQQKPEVSGCADSNMVSCDGVLQSTTNRPAIRRARVPYKYQPVQNDLD